MQSAALLPWKRPEPGLAGHEPPAVFNYYSLIVYNNGANVYGWKGINGDCAKNDKPFYFE